MKYQSAKHKLYSLLESENGSKFDNYLLATLIVLNVITAVIETMSDMRSYSQWFGLFEAFSITIFTAEYLLRVWVATEQKSHSHPVWGRLHYIFSPLALIDLLAILPFYLPFLGVDLRFLRLLRLLRIFKLARYSSALQTIGRIFWLKRNELLLTLFSTLVLLVFSSSIVYYVENEAQPDSFSSIPAAMWWGVATVTTVGYGDIYPITPFGKLFTALIAILGIGLFALPTGILAGGFAEELQSHRQEKDTPHSYHYCPHCGSKLTDAEHADKEQKPRENKDSVG